MREEKLISVIIPVYNVERYLEKCVQSVCEQTYRNLEIILVDDGSPDNCPGLCDKLAQCDTRITVLHKANSGVSSARNAGLDRARGAYVSFVDADDWIAPEMYSHLMAAMEEQRTNIAICGCRVVDEMGTEGETWAMPETRCLSHVQGLAALEFIDMKKDRVDYGLHYCIRRCWSMLFQKDLLEDVRFDESISMGEDTLFVTHALLRCDKIAICQGAFYYYLTRKGSAIHSIAEKQHRDLCEMAQKIWVALEPELQRYPQLYPMVLTQIAAHGFFYINGMARANEKAKYWEAREELMAWMPEIRKYASEYSPKYQRWIFLLSYFPQGFWLAARLWYHLRYKRRNRL